MVRMNFVGDTEAHRAVVEIWAAQALVSDTHDWRITAIAYSLVLDTAALLTKILDVGSDAGRVRVDRRERMSWMMTVLAVFKAEEA